MKNSMPNVAVLLTTYNGENFVDEQLSSIFGQMNINLNLFISDDCSTDGTLKKVLNLCNDKNNYQIINHSTKYGSACENFLNMFMNVDFEKYDYIALSDQDDIWLPNKLINAIKKINENNSSGYSSNVISWNPDTHELKNIVKSNNQTKYDFMFQGPGPGCTFVLKKKDALEFKSFIKNLDIKYRKKINHHDWFIYAFYRANNKKWFIDSYSGMIYRQHSSNVVGSNIGISGITERLKVLRDWRRQSILFSKILDYEKNLPIIKIKKFGIYIIKTPFKSRRTIKESLMLFIASIFRIF